MLQERDECEVRIEVHNEEVHLDTGSGKSWNGRGREGKGKVSRV